MELGELRRVLLGWNVSNDFSLISTLHLCLDRLQSLGLGPDSGSREQALKRWVSADEQMLVVLGLPLLPSSRTFRSDFRRGKRFSLCVLDSFGILLAMVRIKDDADSASWTYCSSVRSQPGNSRIPQSTLLNIPFSIGSSWVRTKRVGRSGAGGGK